MHGQQELALFNAHYDCTHFQPIHRAGAERLSRPSPHVLAVRVEELKGKIKLAFPANYPQAAILVATKGTVTTRGRD